MVLKLKNIKYKGMVAYMFNLSTWEAKQTDFYEFNIGLVYIEFQNLVSNNRVCVCVFLHI